MVEVLENNVKRFLLKNSVDEGEDVLVVVEGVSGHQEDRLDVEHKHLRLAEVEECHVPVCVHEKHVWKAESAEQGNIPVHEGAFVACLFPQIESAPIRSFLSVVGHRQIQIQI